MSEIPAAIQCPADAEKVCPLRAAEQARERFHELPVEERQAVGSYNEVIKSIADPLSMYDRDRFYAMLGTEFGRSVLHSETCPNGPSKSWGLFGKLTCNADTLYEAWQPAEPDHDTTGVNN